MISRRALSQEPDVARAVQGPGVDRQVHAQAKYTMRYPMERIPRPTLPRDCMRCAAIRTAKNAASPASCASQFARRSRSRSIPNSAPTARAAPRATTSTLFKCIYCGFCEESCPVDSIVETNIHEYHFEKRGENIVNKAQLLAIRRPLRAPDRRSTFARRTVPLRGSRWTCPWNLILFYMFAGVLVLAALGVISVRNSVHAALLLVLTFFTSAALWLLMQAEFLALALVLVYVGAVMVLFLFVVMMLDINTEQLREGYIRYLPVGVLVAAVMLAEMLLLLGVKAMAIPAPADPGGASNTAWLGNALFTQYLLPFETAAVILTVRRDRGDHAHFASSHQHALPETRRRKVAVKARDRIRIVKMESSKMESSTVKEAPAP